MVSEEGWAQPRPGVGHSPEPWLLSSPPRCFPSFSPPVCSVEREESLSSPVVEVRAGEQTRGEAEGFILAEASLERGYSLPSSKLPPALHLSVWIREPRESFPPTSPNHSKSLFFE